MNRADGGEVAPDFGREVAHRSEACTPRELYRALLDVEDHVHYLEPAFRFAMHALRSPLLPAPKSCSSTAAMPDLLLGEIAASRRRVRPSFHASSWPVRVMREFAPTALVDGCWLTGLTWLGQVENRVGMAALKQYMLRCGDPGTADSAVERYRALLRSLGVPPGSIARWEPDEFAPCSDLSYEHALLGLTLGLFPTYFRPEIAGFNLWMASIGPCPLAADVLADLRTLGVCGEYFERSERDTLIELARAMVVHVLESEEESHACERAWRGFFAAERSYCRWESAVCGGHVPVTPRDCVLEIVRRKARFARGHHGRITVAGCPVESVFAGPPSEHGRLLDALARSPLVQPGNPGASRLVNETISIDGPMFDIFTAAEQRDLREWIAALGSVHDATSVKEPVPLEGAYTPPQDLDSLRSCALRTFEPMSEREVIFHLVNPDRCPAVRLFGRAFAENYLAAMRKAFVQDHRLHSTAHPPYSEQAVATMIVDNHDRNLRTQNRPAPDQPPLVIQTLLDGCWLQGFADVTALHLEEYGWLFRIYASEMGDGHLEWNHNYIARQMFRGREPSVALPATDQRFYDKVPIGVASVVHLAMALNTRHFLPELLGLNLAFEARGVCGIYIPLWRKSVARQDDWWTLHVRLHNSIDNYASGHTKWSLAAVQAYLARVNAASPASVDEHWRRIWQLWRWIELEEHGSLLEIIALQVAAGGMSYWALRPAACA